MPPRPAGILLLCTAATLCAGCGQGTRASSSTTRGFLAHVNLRAYADAINLRAGDVPGLVAEKLPRHRKRAEGPLGLAVEACAGDAVRPSEIIAIRSARFREAGALGEATNLRALNTSMQSVQSGVYVLGSEAAAARELAAVSSARARECLKRLLERTNRLAIKPQARPRTGSPSSRVIEVSALPSPLPGVPVQGVRVRACPAATGSCGHSGSEYVAHYLGFCVGRTLITLQDSGTRRAFPSAQERALLALLYARAEGHRR